VTWTGDGNSGRQISHNLKSSPAVIIIKSVSFANNWLYNHNFGASGYDLLYLDLTNSKSSQTYASGAIQAQPTDSSFTLKNSSSVNGSGNTYVAYLFASDAGGFGDDGSESIIKCGSFAHNFSGATVNCGFEPQWILVKAADQANNWYIFDVMRGIVTGGLSGDGDAALFPNTSGAENVNTWGIDVNATGFTVYGNNILSSGNAIYIAIRRPMKTPESGTEVFAPQLGTGSGAPRFVSNFATDLLIKTYRYGYLGSLFGSRLTGSQYMSSASTSAEASDSAFFKFDYQNGTSTSGDANDIGWMFKRATGFMDAVAYSGTSSAHNEEHNLNVVPELMIFKNRSQSGDNWVVYSNVFSPANYIKLNSDSYAVPDASNLRFNNTAPTESVFTVGTSIETNFNGQNYISYLFATLAGVSKVGSYTGTGADLNVDCGFSAGARFVLIKRSDSGGTGDWYVWDSARGIVAGNDPYLLLNSTAAEVTSTDYIDPLSSGFTVTSSAPAALNASGGTYIFLAIA
jgi:hypothetical protein